MSDSVPVLDARNLLCPVPVIRLQNRVRELAPGDELDVVATDPGVLQDIPAWCRVHGHRVIETTAAGREFRVRVQVGDAMPPHKRAPDRDSAL